MHASTRSTVRALRTQGRVVYMGSMVSVAPHGLVVALRQLLWQEESRTVSPMSGAAGSLEDGRGMSAAGQHPGGTDE